MIKELTKRVAALEAKAAKDVAAFVEENKDVIPESLRKWAKTLDLEQVHEFVALLRKGGGQQALMRTARANGDPGGVLPAETKRHMDRIFGNQESWPVKAARRLPGGGFALTHLTRKPR